MRSDRQNAPLPPPPAPRARRMGCGTCCSVPARLHWLSGPASAFAPAKGPVALIAEDDAFYRAVLLDCFERFGYRGVGVADGRVAWALAADYDTFDVIVANWLLPGLDGHMLVRRLKEGRRTNALTVLTHGAVAPACAPHALLAHADARLVKPYGPSAVRAVLRERRAVPARGAIQN